MLLTVVPLWGRCFGTALIANSDVLLWLSTLRKIDLWLTLSTLRKIGVIAVKDILVVDQEALETQKCEESSSTTKKQS